MMAEIRFYLALFWRRFPLFVFVFTLFAMIGVFAAFTLPPVYRSQARLLVEDAQISENLATSTVQSGAREKLQRFEAQLLTRSNLLDIANRLQVFENQRQMNPDQIVAAMRAATTIRSQSGRDQATLMTLSFESKRPTMAAIVLDEYLTFIQSEDAEYRTGRAGQTQSFFQQEVDRLGEALSAQSARILDFKNANADALPEGLDFRQNLQLDLQDTLSRIDREAASLKEQQQRLQQVYDSTGRISDTSAMTVEERRLQELRNQLTELEAIYSSTSPRVISLKNRIAQLEAALVGANGTGTEESDPTRTMFDLQMSEITTRITQLEEERQRTADQLVSVQDAIARTPGNAIALAGLERDYENLQGQYNAAVERLSTASTGERIETLSQGQRVTIVEHPGVPSEPFKPNRKLVAAMGFAGGLGAGAALIVVLELLSGTVKRSADLVNGLGLTPLATVPYMRTRREILRRRMIRIGISLAILLVVPTIMWAIHTYYMPFDMFARKVAAKIGLYI
jgi:polysaccharide chain length determinant protein (PEP-CTERM system associated)